METYNKAWRLFFATALIAIAIQQMICGGFRPLFIPEWPEWLPGRIICVYIFSIMMILAGFAIILEKSARTVAGLLGVIFLVLLITFHIPYQVENNLHFLGGWSDAFKELAFSGGAFIVAASLPKERGISSFIDSLLPAGRFLFAITMIVFGIEHFIYVPFVAMLVPAWIPGHTFWAYFAGVALILAGGAIFINVLLKPAAMLLGIMLFLWFIMLHIPRAIADPHSGSGNEWTSVFEALAFSGIALLLASGVKRKVH